MIRIVDHSRSLESSVVDLILRIAGLLLERLMRSATQAHARDPYLGTQESAARAAGLIRQR